jgi:hypothetical protein
MGKQAHSDSLAPQIKHDEALLPATQTDTGEDGKS